jgi:hypothetical protein
MREQEQLIVHNGGTGAWYWLPDRAGDGGVLVVRYCGRVVGRTRYPNRASAADAAYRYATP